MKFATTEYGTPRCPLPHLAHFYDDADRPRSEMATCDEEVALIVQLYVSIPTDDETVTIGDAGRDALTSQWTVECGRGHVLAASDGEENAEDFNWVAVFGPDALLPHVELAT